MHYGKPRVLGSLAGLLLAGAIVGGAAAAQPTREWFPLPPEIVDEGCGYPIVATFPVNRQYAMSFVDRDGDVSHFIIAGGLVVLFTNPDTGDTLKIAISGPTHFFYDGNLFGGQGTWVLFPEGTLIVTAGQNTTSDVLRGTIIHDICEALPPA